MSWPKARLAFFSLLFLIWSVWLGWQVWATGSPLLVSQPQLLAAPVVVAADVKDGQGNGPREAVIQQVFKGAGLAPAVMEKLQIMDWPAAKAPGAGLYLLALQPVDRANARYLLVPIPVSPGFYYRGEAEVQRPVYALTDSVLKQMREILK